MLVKREKEIGNQRERGDEMGRKNLASLEIEKLWQNYKHVSKGFCIAEDMITLIIRTTVWYLKRVN